MFNATPEEQRRAATDMVSWAEAGKLKSQIDVFMDAGHGFFADYRPSYNEADAKLAWSRTLEWYRKHGV